MRLTPWFLPFALSAALLTTTGYVFADNHPSEGEQHKPLNDAALEEEYGIKAGAVKREESERGASSEQPNGADENNGEITADGDEVAEGGTGGTGSPEVAIESGEDDKSTEDDGETGDSTGDNE